MSASISVVIPCHDLGRYLGEALASVERQTRPAAEIVIVDDASTDAETLEVLRAIKDRARVLSGAFGGPGAARNAGVRATSGDYVCCLDADDELLPTYFAQVGQALDGSTELAFASTWVEAFGSEAWVARPYACDLAQVLTENPLHVSALVRRSVFESVGGFDEALRGQFEDWDLWLRVLGQGFHGTIVPEVLFRYRRRARSLSEQATTSEFAASARRALVTKHAALYRASWLEMACVRNAMIAELDHREAKTEDPSNAGRFEEQGRLLAEVLEARAEQARGLAAERAQFEAARAAYRHELEGLHASLSWRITGPLRGLYERLRRL